MPALALHVSEIALPLVHPFAIARRSIDVARTALLRLRWNGLEGLGEAAPVPRYGESVTSIQAYFAEHALACDDPFRLEDLLHDGLPRAARCCLDLALHDLIGKSLNRPLWQLLGLDPAKTPVTSFTIGISDMAITLRKVAAVADHPVLKIKLGAEACDDVATIEAIRNIYTGTIRIDANEGWTPDDSVRYLREMERFDIEFCEQPIPAGQPQALRWIRERVGIPIVADEDSLDASSLRNLVDCV